MSPAAVSNGQNGHSDSARFRTASSEEAYHLEHEHSAHNYHPLPVTIARGSAAEVWDPENK
jgi:ornithine--oxo-acid transaminase